MNFGMSRTQTWVVVCFAVSRLLYWLAGVRFDARPVEQYWQVVDPVLLRDRLWESLFYLHTQPPGFNLMIGLALKWFPQSYGEALHAVHLIFGLSLCFSLYGMMREMGVREHLAGGITVVYLISPGVVLFENLLIYDYPLLAVLSMAGLALVRYVKRADWGSAICFFVLLLALGLYRAVFQLAYLALIAVALCLWRKKDWKKTATAAAIPVLILLGIYVKNKVLFGVFNSSTWMGAACYTITAHNLSEEEKARLLAAGVVSPLVKAPTGPLATYAGLVPVPPPTGIPVLDQWTDSTGRPNFNQKAYIQIFQGYCTDAKSILIHYPKAYLRSVAIAWFTYFLPSGDFPFFDLNRPKIRGWDRLWNIAIFGQWKETETRKELRVIAAESPGTIVLYTGTFLLVGLPLLFVWGCRMAWKWWNGTNPAQVALLWFALFHIAFVTLLVNSVSSYECNRYRLCIEGFYVLLLGMAVERMRNWPAIRSRER